MKNAKRVAQRRLKYLVEQGLIYRKRVTFEEPYIYYNDRKANTLQAPHVVATNWAILYMESNMKGYQKLKYIAYEQDYEILRCDAIVGIWCDKANQYYFHFIEADISHNDFDKVGKYNDVYEKKLYAKKWWTDKAVGFPSIVIVTRRQKLVHRKIIKENRCDLEFINLDYDKMRGDLIGDNS